MKTPVDPKHLHAEFAARASSALAATAKSLGMRVVRIESTAPLHITARLRVDDTWIGLDDLLPPELL